jgi:pSer/pThr/pTyr-binding forkhead associated (FHA) protein
MHAEPTSPVSRHDCQLQIVRGGVSRRLALNTAAIGGCAVKDLGSQNGTFVNGERNQERTPPDADRIVIGDTQLIVRTPWPEPST